MNPDAKLLSASPQEIQAIQLTRLKETLARAKRAPYFAERLKNCEVRSLDDLAKLPLTTKEDLQQASPFGSVAVPPTELFQYHESFGTTGTPCASWLTKNDFQEYAAQVNQSDINFAPGDVVVNKFPYAISVPAHIFKLAAQNRGACVVSASSLTSICPYTRTLDLMLKLRASVLTCLPTEATLLGAAAATMGLNPRKDFNLRAIGTAGELLTNGRRKRIEELWGCKVYNFYGTTETGNLATEGEDQKLQLAWDHFLVEILDEKTMQPLPIGSTGLPAITTLTREAMPLIRYLLTDRVKLEQPVDSPSGRRSPIVHHYGRDQSRFPFQGKDISLSDLEERVFRLPRDVAGDIWMIVVTPQTVYFRVEAQRFDPALYAKAEKEISAELGFPMKIDAVPPGAVFPVWWLMEPARVGKPAYHCEAETLEQAPKSLPELWLGPAYAGPPPGMDMEGMGGEGDHG
ncbi:MAG: phenylacetate--CoA ligase family protein [Pirellulales bacterium]